MSTAQRDGVLLAASAVIGMALMNSPLAPGFAALLDTRFGISLGSYSLDKTVAHWINDGLMALFFLIVGIEIKHEWYHGSLATPQARVLPFGAAIGGMAVPALIFAAVNWGEPANLAGWAIPAATDIAFAIGLMALLAPRTAPALLAFLVAVAVIDDLGAIIVIALFYTDQLSKTMLALAAACTALLLMLASLKVQRLWPYLLAGTLLWFFVLKSGVHATLAGVITGLLLPHQNAKSIEHTLKPWISWLVLPLFGVVNAGVFLGNMSAAVLLQPISLGVALGLLVGKPIGIMLGTFITSKLAGGLPSGMRLKDYLPVACFCGVGFTMALFIGTLAYEPGTAAADAAKLGVLLGTLCSLALGTLMSRLVK